MSKVLKTFSCDCAQWRTHKVAIIHLQFYEDLPWFAIPTSPVRYQRSHLNPEYCSSVYLKEMLYNVHNEIVIGSQSLDKEALSEEIFPLYVLVKNVSPTYMLFGARSPRPPTGERTRTYSGQISSDGARSSRCLRSDPSYHPPCDLLHWHVWRWGFLSGHRSRSIWSGFTNSRFSGQRDLHRYVQTAVLKVCKGSFAIVAIYYLQKKTTIYMFIRRFIIFCNKSPPK